jgi:hypothetical protein
MPNKHLILVHGRSTKPSEKEKGRLVRETLLHGLDRSSPEAASLLRSDAVQLSIAYYGDICNALLLEQGESEPGELLGLDADHDGAPCELPGSYDDGLAKLFAREDFTKSSYGNFLDTVPDNRYRDNMIGALSGVLNLMGMSEKVIREATPDMGAYLTNYETGSAIRSRLQQHLEPSLRSGDDVCLVSHSMGCIVSYDVLWKYSRMSEYEGIRNRKISSWITLGNPLGEPGVQENLYDAKVDASGRFPTNIEHWTNIAAHDDFVAHDEDMADDFAEMLRPREICGTSRPLVKSITDSRMYNFWAGDAGSNPHKLYGYLDNPHVAQEIARWVLS